MPINNDTNSNNNHKNEDEILATLHTGPLEKVDCSQNFANLNKHALNGIKNAKNSLTQNSPKQDHSSKEEVTHSYINYF